PSHFPTALDGVVYSPRNYDGVFRGPLRARPALAGSENIPAVWTLSQVGVPGLLRLLRQAGLTTLDKSAEHYGFALTMGDAEVRAGGWVGGFARQGLRTAWGAGGGGPFSHAVLLPARGRVGGRGPGPDDPPLAAPPPDLVPRQICALSGLAATELCPSVETEWLPPNRPLSSCRWHGRRQVRVVVTLVTRHGTWTRVHGPLGHTE